MGVAAPPPRGCIGASGKRGIGIRTMDHQYASGATMDDKSDALMVHGPSSMVGLAVRSLG
jgi:hypothetical protein